MNVGLEAGCGVVTHRDFPFKYFPIDDRWRFDLDSKPNSDGTTDLEKVLNKLIAEQRDFKKDNLELVQLAETPWEKLVEKVFG